MKRILSMIWAILTRFTALSLILGAGFVFGTTLIAVRSQERVFDERPAPVSVIAAVEQETYVAKRKFAGRLAAGQVSDVSFQLPGQIVEILVDEGETVDAGAALARLDDAQLQNRRDELTAQREEADSQLTRADADLQRTAQLLERGFATEQARDALRAERDGLRARVRQIEAALAAVDEDIADSTLEAPFGGEVVRRYIDQGTVVQPGQPVVRINETGLLEARIGIPITYRGRISVGDIFEVSAGDLKSDGVVSGVISDVNTGTRTLTVILEITDDPGFVPRDLVRMTLAEEVRDSGVWVPAQALNESIRGLWSVYIVEREEGAEVGTVRRKDVEIIHIEEDRIFVTGTLTAGDEIVVSGAFRFVPGQPVRVVGEPRA
ncbi:MAG: efflux RND transporter periplasmic adaptor subunit [Pseudomonadota bacterium]